MNSQTFKITNITCDACVKLSTKALKVLPGVEKVNVDRLSGVSVIETANEVSWEQITSTLKTVGKEAVKIN
jgi:copper chaperone CopZ